jgi:hypothetical protein
MTITFQGARAFRHRNYRLFFGGQAISLVGTWMQQVAQGWLVLQLTHDPLWLGLVSLAQFGPVIVLGLFGGVIADQLPKRKTLMATQSVAMILAFALFALTALHVVQVWHVMVLAALLGIANAFDMPARQSFAVEMVGRDDAGFSLAEIGQLLEDEAARTRNRARFRTTTDVAERRAIVDDALARVERQIASLREKADRLAAMIDEAEGRRDHLLTHIAEIEAGVEPAPHDHPAARSGRAPRTRAGR